MRRHDADCPSDQLCVGIALPPCDGDKVRLPLRVALGSVARWQSPLSIPHVVSAMPSEWRDAATCLHDAALHADVPLQIYGSAALQAITGLSYLHPTSDLDVLMLPSTSQQLDDCVRLFITFEKTLPLDGEIVFASGHAVAAKEWCNAVPQPSDYRVLAKHATGVALMRKDALMAVLDRQSCIPQ